MTSLDETASGVYVIAPTPFDPGGALDLASTDRMIEFFLDRGATGLTILGIMGEAPKLTTDEAESFVARVIRRTSGRVPVVVGVSSPGLAAMRDLAASAMDLGAAGVMVAPVPNLRTDDQIHGWFVDVAETLGPATPFVLQDYPLTTQVQIAPGVILRIIRDLPTCVMVKHEDWPGLAKISALRAAEARGDSRRVAILTGNGGLFLPEEMARGADGSMTGFAYPEMMVGVIAAFRSDAPDCAQDLFDAYLPLARYEQQPGIGLAVRKHILCRRGAILTPTLRKPAPRLADVDIAEIERLIARQERRLAELG